MTSSQKLIANVNNNNQNFKLLINSTDNDTRITEYSLHPSRNYLAIAEIDYPKLQSTTDSIKVIFHKLLFFLNEISIDFILFSTLNALLKFMPLQLFCSPALLGG